MATASCLLVVVPLAVCWETSDCENCSADVAGVQIVVGMLPNHGRFAACASATSACMFVLPSSCRDFVSEIQSTCGRSKSGNKCGMATNFCLDNTACMCFNLGMAYVHVHSASSPTAFWQHCDVGGNEDKPHIRKTEVHSVLLMMSKVVGSMMFNEVPTLNSACL